MLTSVVQVAHNSSRERPRRAGGRLRLPVATFISQARHSQIGTRLLDCQAASSLCARQSLIAARLLPGICSPLSARQSSAVTSLPWPPWRLIYGSAIRNRRSDQDRRPERTKRVEGPLCRALLWRPWRLIYGSAIRDSANLPGFSDMQNSNRRHNAYFSYDSSHHLSAIELRRQISNSNIRHFRNSSNSRKNNTCVISNSNKTRYSWNPGISSLPALGFSARAFSFRGTVRSKSGWFEFEPHSVVAIISPWNFPFAIPMTEIIPALVAGNAVLLKPSELTPPTRALVGELIEQASFPEGLVQVLQSGSDVGAAIIEAGPAKVFFTGSVDTGRRIAEACAKKLIPSVLELGGKDAMIVLADADLEIASSAAVWGGFMNCGETCISVERVYVEQSIVERFTQLCVAKTKKLRVGPASDPDVEIGPMIRLRQLEKVEAQLRDAVTRGAQI